MGKLASKVTKRIMASLLTIAMIMSNMTVYASEYSEPAALTDETAENAGTDTVQLPSADDGAVQGDAAGASQDTGTQDETADDQTSQEGIEGDAQDASDENSDSVNNTEGGDVSAPKEDGGEASEPEEIDGDAQEPEETDGDVQEPEEELEPAEVSEDAGTPAAQANTHTLWIVGDSTVCSFTDNYYYPRYGYGTQIQNYLDSTYTVNNLALSGRSSKSFTGESNYQTLKAGMKQGDVLVIGFGHNDEKAAEDRYTNPNGDYQTEGSFAYSLYENYIKIAQAAGTDVILCTPIVRRNSSGTLSNANCHITSNATDKDGNEYPGGDYPKAIRDLGTAVNVPVVDLTALTKAKYEEVGAAGTLKFHAWTSNKETSADDTHLNVYGAKMVAWMFANKVKDISGLDLASHIDLSKGEPTEAADLKSNPNYVEKEYEPPTESSTICKDYVIEGNDGTEVHFRGTAFGNLGGTPTAANNILETDSNGKMHIQVKNNKGKIASGGDGITMYYYQVPAGKTFTFSAKASLNSTLPNQDAFGLMARDDMYIDVNEDGIISDYVVAGSWTNSSGSSNCFYRKNGALGGRGTLAGKVESGRDYDLSIVYNGDGYACKFGDEQEQSGGYDFQLTSVDSDYVYIGMFVARSADVTFSNIYLVIDDEVIIDARKDEYNINVTSAGHGTAKSNNAKASEGSTVVLSATPDDGYMFKQWNITSAGTITHSVDNQFIMPENAVDVEAVFEEVRRIWDFENDADLTGTNGISREGKGTNTTFYAAGLLVDATEGKWDSTGSGEAIVSKDTSIIIPVKECTYAKVTVKALTKDYTVDYTNDATLANAKEEFVCEASSGEILLEITGPDNTAEGSEDALNKILYIEVEPDYNYNPPTPKANIQVWDFAGMEVEDTDLYTNNITPGLIRKKGIVAKGGLYGDDSATFGDLEMKPGGGDRFYTSIPKLSAYNNGSYATAYHTYADGYTTAGAWYGNGAGDAKSRTVKLTNVKAGDKIVAYMGSHQTGGCEFTFAYEDATKQKETVSVSRAEEFNKFEFIAQYDGAYNIYQSGGTGKIMYHRIMKMPVVTVSGTIDRSGLTTDENAALTDYTVRFYNEDKKIYTDADVDATANTFTVKLTPGYHYRAVLNAQGYGFTSATKSLEVAASACETCKIEDKVLKVQTVSTYPYSGKIEGFAAGYYDNHKTGFGITMIPDESATDSDEVDLEIEEVSGELTFSANLDPEVEYTLQMEGVYDYEITAPESVTSDGNDDYTNQTITVALKTTYAVTGKFTGLDETASVTKLTLTNIDDNYSYDATIDSDGKGYSIDLRNGTYLASATVTGYSTKTHVTVKGKAVNRDIMFVSTTAKGSITYAADIYVKYTDKDDNNYDTVSEAVEACGLMNRTSDQRVTVHIAPGTYREQIVIDTPNISFVNDNTNKEVLLTWYYGIGYKYYSANDKGFYDPENAYDKFDKNKAEKWGTAVYIKDAAKAFRADGITFENSFNRYITDEELADGVELLNNPQASTITIERTYDTDILGRSETERAAAIVVEGDQAEFVNCGFYSSQDTLYTGGTTHSYFKNCTIEGQTDYIFGGGNAVFDACELSWKGYSTNVQGGYITANRSSATEQGYLLRNCTVTGTKNSKLTVASGYLGRPWEATSAVVFMNTKLQNVDYIESAGWTAMSGNDPQNARYKEYNTTTTAGTPVTTTGRVSGTVIDAAAAAAITVADYFGTWTPYYYVADAGTLAFTKTPYISDNGDANLPKPGHTLTVRYSLGDNDDNDASLIQWYSVTDANDSGTLLKSSTASVDKTYQIEASTVGKYIKVTVTPQTISGQTAAAQSFTMDAVVQDGYDDPSGGSDITLGDGINIFLAGDSTVKDYSAKGMYEKTKGGEDLGSWGEFIQKFFDEDKITIQNYANGGRSTRNFINEGSLEEIKKNIGEGDYLFIQFAHNDCSNTNADRYVPVGTPDSNGIYPSTPGTLDSEGEYPDGGSGTYKWFLKQYIKAAEDKGAIPVLVTPVARMYYDTQKPGTIRPHHDDANSTDNAYVKAMNQVAEEENVLLIDGFGLTKQMFEDAWKADDKNSAYYGNQVMGLSKTTNEVDKTHNNKLGGIIEALLIAQAIQDMDINISKYVKAPSGVRATTLEGDDHKVVFTISVANVLTAYDIGSDYEDEATYWEGYGQAIINAISGKAAELNPPNPENPDVPDNPDNPDNPNNPTGNSEGLKITLTTKEYTYTGSAITPAIKVTNNGIALTAGVDYTVKYSNNKNANDTKDEKKKAKITVTGKGSFSGKCVEYFTINPKSLTKDDNDKNPVIDGSLTVVKNKKVAPVLVYNGVKLAAKDFTIEGDSKFSAAGDKSVTVKGKGNFTGSRPIAVKVVDKNSDLKKITKITLDKNSYTYTGSAIEPVPTVKSGSDTVNNTVTDGTNMQDKFIVTYSEDHTNVGTAKVTVIGKGEYTGTVTKSYKITADKSLSITAALKGGANASYPYGVTVPDEDITVTVGSGNDAKTLVKDVDYKVTYSGNKKVTKGNAKAKCKITCIGNYKGCKTNPQTLTFAITPAVISNDTVNVVATDKIFKNTGVYKSVPLVINKADGTLLKKSDYTVAYYIKDSGGNETEMKGSNKVTAAGTTIVVKVTGKGNYVAADATGAAGGKVCATGEYKVSSAEGKKDLSKAKIEIYKKGTTPTKVTKVDYTGKPITFEGDDSAYELKVNLGTKNAPDYVNAADYEIKYANNTNKGKATIVIVPKADNSSNYNCVGGKTATFSIVAQKVPATFTSNAGNAATTAINMLKSVFAN